MLNKLAMRNARRSMGDYMVYLLTMVLIVALMFAFNSMVFSKSIKILYAEAGIFGAMIGIATFFIVLIVIWLVHYMVRFMAEKRSREFGTYLLLGFHKKQVANLFLRENMLLGIAAFVIGLFPGFFLQQVLTSIIYAMMHKSYALKLEVKLYTFLMTAGFYALSFLAALLRNKRRFKKMNIHDMMYLDRQNEQQKSGNKAGKQWMLFAAVFYFLFFAWMLLDYRFTMGNAFFLAAGLAAAIYFLYTGLSAFLIRYIRKGGSATFKSANLFVFRQLASKVKTMQFTLGTLTILFATALVGCSCALMLNHFLNTQAEEKWPFDIAIYSEKPEDDFGIQMEIIRQNTQLEEALRYLIYQNGADTMKRFILANLKGTYEENYFNYDTYIKLSDYNQLRKLLGYEPVELKENQYLLHVKKRMEKTAGHFVKTQELRAAGIALECKGIYTEGFEQSGHNGADYLLVVPDETAEQMTPYYSMLVCGTAGRVPDNLGSLLVSAVPPYNEFNDEQLYDDRGAGSDQIYVSGSYVMVRENEITEMNFLMSTLIFPLFYIGMVFLCVALTVLSVQQLSDSAKYRFRYMVLGKLGLGKREVRRVILKELAFYYLCPFAAAVLLSGGISLFIGNQFVFYAGMQIPSWWYFGGAVLIFAAVYLIYFAVTYEEFKRNVEK